MIEVKNLVKKYGNHVAVNDATFTINDGEVVGFIGPNGAGKSTTMNIITGYLSSTSGTASINGFDILENPTEAKKHIGYLPEQPPLYVDMTVQEYLNFVYDLKGTSLPRKPHLEEICKLVKIEGVQKRLIRNLSKGYRQRVGIAQALVGNPDVLILDEPTVGLDPQQIIEIRALISQLGKNHTVILSSHILSEIQAVCHRFIIINRGRIIADDTADQLSERVSNDRALNVLVVGPPREVKETLEGIPGIESVRVTGIFERATQFEVTPKAGVDIRRHISERIVGHKWQLLEISSRKMSLEDVFLNLISKDPEQLFKERFAPDEETHDETVETDETVENSSEEPEVKEDEE